MNSRSVFDRVHLWRAPLRRVLPALVVLCLPWLALSASEKPKFDSQLRDGAITIDGKYDDWYGTLTSFGNDPVSIQFLNDADYLYMRMTASDSAARSEIVRQGLIVWFDPAGGTKKHLGIRFPIVEHGQGGGQFGPGGPGGGGSGGYGGGYGGHGGGRSRPAGVDGDPSAPPPDDAPLGSDRVDILGPGKDDARSLTREHLQGIDVALRRDQGSLQYELRVPLAKTADHPYAIEAVAGKPVGVGLETGKAEQGAAGSGRGGGGGFGGGGGGGGMGGRGGGGMGGGGGRGGGMHGGGGGGGREGHQPPKPIKGWGLVTIASAPPAG